MDRGSDEIKLVGYDNRGSPTSSTVAATESEPSATTT